MKKAFFAFVAVSAIVLSACNNKPAESTETTVDTTAVVTETTTETTTVDTTAVVTADTTHAATPAH